MLRSLIILLSLVALAPGLAASQQQTLTLREAYELARERNPMLHASRAAADAVATQESSAVLPPDPEIQLGVMNASLPGLGMDMPGSMLPSVQAMQMIPFPGKLRLGGQIARQSTAMARSATDETWWEVRATAAMAFYEIYQADRQLAVMEETLDWLRQFEQVATAMYSVGGGRQSDVLRAGVEVARMKADIARMRAMRTAAAARLNAVLDRPSDTPVPAVAFAALPRDLPPAGELQNWAEQSRPMLERGRIGVEQARTREALARRELWPDLTLGVQYGQRPAEMGTERMGSLMLGFSVPVFAGQRQVQMRREAAAMEQMARADLTGMRAGVSARIGELLAELDRARTLVTLYRTEVLPQAEANVTSAFSSYRVGRVDFMTLLDAQMTLNQYNQELYALLAEYGRMIAELEMTIGRELPPTATTLAEDA
jgi:outer membrane protein, heavy metal efflux system